MAEEIKKEIAQISEDTKAAIRRKTAEILPDNPTAAGMKAADIKAAFFKGLTDSNLSILAELARVITEANEVAKAEAKTIASLGERISDEEIGRSDADTALKAEIEDALKEKVGTIRQSYAGNSVTYAYGVDNGGETKLVKGNYSAEPSTLVYRDTSGHIVVKAPQNGGNPIPKSYFDAKSNNSLYSEVMANDRRVKNLICASNGKLFENVTLVGSGTAVQVDNACPYGILTRLGGNVARIRVGVPFNLAGSSNVTDTSLNSFVTVSGKTPYIRCDVPAGVSVSVNCDGLNGATVKEFALASGVGGSYFDGIDRFDPGETVVSSQANKYIYMSRSGSDFVNFRVMLSNYETASIYGDVDEIEIPAEIRALDGYGATGAYIDFAEQKFYSASGAATDISALLPAEIDVISLLPSAIIKFTDASGNAVTAEYELSYKNKL